MSAENIYNYEIKERFVNEKASEVSNPSYLFYWFRKTYDKEVELNKDLCNWTTYEIIEFYKMVNTSSVNTLMTANCIFAKYTNFCFENNLVIDSQNHFLECTIDIIKGCINKVALNMKIIDRQKIVNLVRQLPNPKDQFILLGTFEFGKSVNNLEILRARFSDMTETSNGATMKLGERVVKISPELVDIIKNCDVENTYYGYSNIDIIPRPLMDSGFLIKKYSNENRDDIDDFTKGKNIYNISKKACNYLGIG